MTNVTKELKDRWEFKQWVNDYMNDHGGDRLAWEKVSKDPWLYDRDVTLEEAMILKLKDQSQNFHKQFQIILMQVLISLVEQELKKYFKWQKKVLTLMNYQVSLKE